MDPADEWSTKCILCEKDLQKGVVTTVRRFCQYISMSKARKDGKHLIFENRPFLVIHTSCSKSYTSRRALQQYKKKVQSSEASTSGNRPSNFDYENLCIFCGGDASDAFIAKQKKETPKSRVKVGFFLNNDTRQFLISAFNETTDKDRLLILNRLYAVEDFVSSRARYHVHCNARYRSNIPSSTGISEPRLAQTVAYIISYITNHEDECQFSLNKILSELDADSVPSIKYLKKRLNEISDSQILIHSSKDGPIISVLNTDLKRILTEQWYTSKEQNEDNERLRIVKLAATIVLEDIRKKVYETNYYKDVSTYDREIENIPETLRTFVNTVILSNKKQNIKNSIKVNAIAHAIINATRPRSFISPLLLGLGVTLNKKFASKELLQILSAFGFSVTYDEVNLYQASILNHNQEYFYGNGTVQTVGDNADHDTQTLSGHGTLHVMGRIEIVTPKPNAVNNEQIPRLLSLPSARELGHYGEINLRTFVKPNSSALAKITAANFQEKCLKSDVKTTEFLWLYGKFVNNNCIGWNGFMQKVFKDLPYEPCKIRILPFINNPASSYDTIYTVLLEAEEKCKKLKQKHMFVTFDQPLYIKAREIVACCNDQLPSIIVRLGGFHTLLSFMGSIGYIMAGSGLKDVLSEVYAEKSVDKILTGHAYSRAVRAHTLTHAALSNLIFDSITFLEDEKRLMNEILENLDNNVNILKKMEEGNFKKLFSKFYRKVKVLERKGPVSQLWIQYFNLVTILKNFICAERSGNWALHLETAKNMIPYFHAAGHHLYAKSAQLYLQDMYNLENIMDPIEFNDFTTKGRFAVRLTDKFWSGIWSDMAIEMGLMKVMKTKGGLTHGRGVTESVISKWIFSMPATTDICDFIMNFCNVSYGTSDQHVDARESRIKRDAEDLSKLLVFFNNHEPFMESDKIMNINTGMKGDDTINCFKAFEIGVQLMNNVEGLSFDKFKYSKKNRVIPLQGVHSFKINNEVVVIDPTLIFQRICVTADSKTKLREYFSYELAPYPVALFDNGCMRKTQKSKLYDFFTPLENFNLEDYINVVDGGFLLHKVVWHKQDTFGMIINRYIDYIKNHYKQNSCIIFDGYPEISNIQTKTYERLRRQTKEVSREIEFNRNTVATVPQDKFLCNNKNKQKLIQSIQEELFANGFRTKSATEDADTLIVSTAITESVYTNVIIVGEDIDLLVVLTQLASHNKNIYFEKPSKGNVPSTIYDSNSFQDIKYTKNIAFIHAFTGCDTTSAFYNQGKGKIIKILQKNPEIGEQLVKFNDINSDKNQLIDLCCNVTKLLYGAKNYKKCTLNEFRYNCFQKCTIKSNFKLENLPPTESSIAQHCHRVYLQVQQWYGNNLNPLSWGWKASEYGLQPIFTESQLLPDEIIKNISCSCKSNCTKSCGCVKQGIKCSDFCINCSGKNCANSEEIVNEENEIDNDIRENSVDNDNSYVEEVPVANTLFDYESDDNDDDVSGSVENPSKKPRLNDS